MKMKLISNTCRFSWAHPCFSGPWLWHWIFAVLSEGAPLWRRIGCYQCQGSMGFGVLHYDWIFMVSRKFLAFLAPVLCKRHTLIRWSFSVSLEFCTSPFSLSFLGELPGDTYEADLKLYKIYSVILLQRQTITISAVHVGQLANKMATCGISASLPLATWASGTVCPCLNGMSMHTAWRGKNGAAHCAGAFWSASELAKLPCERIGWYHLLSTKATPGFFEALLFLVVFCCESSWSLRCIKCLLSRSYPGYLHILLSMACYLSRKSYIIHKPESSVMTQGRLRAWLLLFVRKDRGF